MYLHFCPKYGQKLTGLINTENDCHATCVLKTQLCTGNNMCDRYGQDVGTKFERSACIKIS